MSGNVYQYQYQAQNASKNDFEKDFFQLMKNSVFGKTEKRVDFRLVTSEEKDFKLLRNLLTKHAIFDENPVGIHKRKAKIFSQ